MKNQNLFDIVTLSDCPDCLGDNHYTNLGVIPVPIILASLPVLQELLGIFGGSGRRALTGADWLKLFPGNGAWTVRLRNHLSRTINYDVDLANIEPFTRYFVDDNKTEICGAGVSFTNCFPVFLKIIEQEKFTGGTSPVGRIPGLTGTLDYASFLPYAIAGVVLIMFLKKK